MRIHSDLFKCLNKETPNISIDSRHLNEIAFTLTDCLILVSDWSQKIFPDIFHFGILVRENVTFVERICRKEKIAKDFDFDISLEKFMRFVLGGKYLNEF